MGFTQGFTWQTSCSCRFRRNVPVELLGLKLLIVCCTVFIVLYVCLFPCCALEPSGEGAWVSGDVPRGGFTVTVTVFIAAKVCPKSGYTRERPSAPRLEASGIVWSVSSVQPAGIGYHRKMARKSGTFTSSRSFVHALTSPCEKSCAHRALLDRGRRFACFFPGVQECVQEILQAPCGAASEEMGVL